MQPVLDTPSSVEEAYERHRSRWRAVMTSFGLDPDALTDKLRVPPSVWFDLQEDLRRELVAVKGDSDELTPRRRRPDSDAILRDFFRRSANTVSSLKTIAEQTGLSEPTVRSWVAANPGSVRKLTRGLYELLDSLGERQRTRTTKPAPNAEMALLEAGMAKLMGHP